MLLWMEGFDHYGDDETNMLDGPWAELSGFVASAPALSSVRARTGSRSLRFVATTQLGFSYFARRVFGGSKTTVGIGQALYMESLPDENNSLRFCSVRDAANADQVVYFVQSTGVISATRAGTLLDSTAAPVVTASAWGHVETKTVIHNSAGAVEVRVNEVTVLNLTGVDTQATANAEASQMVMGSYNSTDISTNWFVDDLFTWDDATSGTNDITDFVGDKKVFTVFPDADTAEADWLLSTGTTGYALIDEATPDDADYIYTSTDGDVSEFGLEDLPSNIAEIIGVQITPRMLKTDAGSVLVAADIVSGAAATSATEIPITTEATYWPFVHTKDPVSSSPFTLSEFNAAKLRLSRVAP